MIAIALLTMSTSRVDPERPVAQLAAPSPASGFDVTEIEIDDLKSVFATVRSRDRIEARVRIAGTITELKVDEGREVKAGEVLALVADQKIALQARGARRADRGRALAHGDGQDRAGAHDGAGAARGSRRSRGFDQAKTAYDTAVNELKSAEAEREVTRRRWRKARCWRPRRAACCACP